MKNIFKNLFKKSNKEEVIRNLSLILILKEMEENLRNNNNPSLPEIIRPKVDINRYDNLRNQMKRLEDAGLKESKNYKYLEIEYNKIDKILKDYSRAVVSRNEDIKKAEDVCKFIKLLKNRFGKDTYLVERTAFNNLCKKYSLVQGYLENYTGIILEENLQEILRIKSIIKSNLREFKQLGITRQENSILSSPSTEKYYKIKEYFCYALSNENIKSVGRVIKWFRNKGDIIPSDMLIKSTDNRFLGWFSLDRHNLKNYTDLIIQSLDWHNAETFLRMRVEEIKPNNLQIAAPKSEFKKLPSDKVIVRSAPIDPIIFRDCPWGVVVFTAWGKEAEDKVLEDYKKFNNL